MAAVFQVSFKPSLIDSPHLPEECWGEGLGQTAADSDHKSRISPGSHAHTGHMLTLHTYSHCTHAHPVTDHLT